MPPSIVQLQAYKLIHGCMRRALCNHACMHTAHLGRTLGDGRCPVWCWVSSPAGLRVGSCRALHQRISSMTSGAAWPSGPSADPNHTVGTCGSGGRQEQSTSYLGGSVHILLCELTRSHVLSHSMLITHDKCRPATTVISAAD